MRTKIVFSLALVIIGIIVLCLVIPYIIAVFSFAVKLILILALVALVAYLIGRYSKSKTL